jgi:hypothetical protein
MPLLCLRSLPRPARLVHRICPGRTGLALALSLALGWLAAGVDAAAAQVSLAWPETAIDYTRYQTVEECLAATARLTLSEARRERITTNVWFDTLPYNPRVEGPSRPSPAVVTAAATHCMARFRDPADLVGGTYDHRQDSLAQFALLRFVMRMYLLANRDADAAAFIAQRIAAKPGSRRLLEGVAIEAYREALPMRTAAAESLYMSRLRDDSPPAQRYNVYRSLWDMAMSVGDTARARPHRAQIMALWPQLPPSQRQSSLAPDVGKPTGQGLFNLLAGFHRQALIDTLRRHGTARYVAAQVALYTQLAGVAPSGVSKFSKLNGFHKLVGQRAPTIVGDFWYRRGDSAAARPTPGRVGLVIFMDATPPGRTTASPRSTDSSATYGSCMPYRNSREDLEAVFRNREKGLHESPLCWEIPAVLRRLAQRFPKLEITVVTQTYGPFVYTAYRQEPTKEAELIRKWLHDVHRTPGALAVTTTSHGYRPEPDGRVAQRLTVPNTANYFSGVGETWSYPYQVLGQKIYLPVVPTGSSFLVDHEGTIATALMINRTEESRLAEVIDVLLQRSGAASQGSGPVAPAAAGPPSRP